MKMGISDAVPMEMGILAFARMTTKLLIFSPIVMNNYYVYILTNKSNKVLYIGVTNNLSRRIYEHKNELIPGFTVKYNVNKLVYYETHDNIEDAIQREKNIKKWYRKWKIELVNKLNPNWEDLYYRSIL